MPRIRFTADPKLPNDLKHLGYKAGTEVDLSEDQANRWLRRGVAAVMPEVRSRRRASEEAAPASSEPDGSAGGPEQLPLEQQPVEIPEDWRDQHHMTRIALARRLVDADEAVETADEADEVIAAELERRAKAE